MKYRTLSGGKLNNDGFSIVEVIITLAILTVAGITLMKAFSIASHTNKTSHELQSATSLAEGTMEEIKQLGIKGLRDTYGESAESYSESLTLDELQGFASRSDPDGIVVIRDINVVDDVDETSGAVTPQFPYFIFYKNDITATSGATYNVVASIKSSPYANTSGIGDNANSIELPQIENIDQSKNVVLSTELSQYDSVAKSNIESQYATPPSGLDTAISKTVYIDLADGTVTDHYGAPGDTTTTPTPTPGMMTVLCRIEYKYEDATLGDKIANYNVYEGTYSATDKASGDIYLFYKHSGLSMDNFEINDQTTKYDKVSHNVYFIEQDDPATREVKIGDNLSIKLVNKSQVANVLTGYNQCSAIDNNLPVKRTNILYTNLYENGSNKKSLETDIHGHVYDSGSDKNNIYVVEVTILDSDGKICTTLESTMNGNVPK